jgi:putative transposase
MVFHERKRLRLEGYDYATPGHYFVTICVRHFLPLFGTIKDGQIILNPYGNIVKQQWLWLAKQYKYVKLEEFVVMPDHFHGILEIIDTKSFPVGFGRDQTLRETGTETFNKIKPLPELIGAFKTTSSKMIHLSGLKTFRWHRSFYDRIVESEIELENIREYIRNNPTRILDE